MVKKVNNKGIRHTTFSSFPQPVPAYRIPSERRVNNMCFVCFVNNVEYVFRNCTRYEYVLYMFCKFSNNIDLFLLLESLVYNEVRSCV